MNNHAEDKYTTQYIKRLRNEIRVTQSDYQMKTDCSAITLKYINNAFFEET